jgi:hypothetical protein
MRFVTLMLFTLMGAIDAAYGDAAPLPTTATDTVLENSDTAPSTENMNLLPIVPPPVLPDDRSPRVAQNQPLHPTEPPSATAQRPILPENPRMTAPALLSPENRPLPRPSISLPVTRPRTRAPALFPTITNTAEEEDYSNITDNDRLILEYINMTTVASPESEAQCSLAHESSSFDNTDTRPSCRSVSDSSYEDRRSDYFLNSYIQMTRSPGSDQAPRSPTPRTPAQLSPIARHNRHTRTLTGPPPMDITPCPSSVTYEDYLSSLETTPTPSNTTTASARDYLSSSHTDTSSINLTPSNMSDSELSDTQLDPSPPHHHGTFIIGDPPFLRNINDNMTEYDSDRAARSASQMIDAFDAKCNERLAKKARHDRQTRHVLPPRAGGRGGGGRRRGAGAGIEP